MEAALEGGIVPGLDLGSFDEAFRNDLLVAITETKDRESIDRLVAALREAV